MPPKKKSIVVPKSEVIVKNIIPTEFQNEAKNMIHNGLSEAILGFTPGGIGTELNQVDTLFKNNRWYLISNMRQLLSEIYVEHGIVQTIVNVPVDDAMRGGVEIKSKQLSPEEIEELKSEMEREDDIGTVGMAQKWNRLFGGSAVIIMTDQDPVTPLQIDLIDESSNLEFRAVDMWELYYDKQNVEGFNPAIEDPRADFYSYYGKKLHKSRVMKMKGLEAPSFIRPRLRGWGFSVVEALVNSINQYLKTNNLVFEVLDEFKVDYYKIKNLTSTLFTDEGTAAVRKRVTLANHQKNFQNAVVMDSEDDFIQKQLTFAGLADIPKETRMQIASDMRMPLTKIFGISASGFSSGEDDIENYNAMVESTVRAKSKFEIIKIIELRCQKKFGHVPSDIKIEFKPLRVLSSEQEESVKTQKFNRLLAARTASEITTKEFKDACNKDNLLSVQLDTSIDTLDVDDDLDDKGDTKTKAAAPKQVAKELKHIAKESPISE